MQVFRDAAAEMPAAGELGLWAEQDFQLHCSSRLSSSASRAKACAIALPLPFAAGSEKQK
jgi:hypothetical protein